MAIYKVLLLLIIITLISPILTNGFGVNLIKVPDEERSQVICTIALLRKYFNSGEPLSGSLLSMSITSALIHVQQSLLHAIHSDNTYPWSVVVKNTRHESPITSPMLMLHEKPQCYFVIIENLEDEDLDDIFEDWRTTINWNPLAQFVVYLASVEETDEEMTELMIEILLNFMNIKIYNVNIIGQNEENGFFYGKTVFPYHPDNNCGNRVIAIETLDICDYQGTERNDEGDEEPYEYDEEGTEDNEDGASDNDKGGDENPEGEDGNEYDDEGTEDNDGSANDNNKGGDENAEGEDGNPSENEDNTGSQENEKTSTEEIKHSNDNNTNQNGQTVESEEKSEVEETLNDKDTSLNDYNNSNDNEDDQISNDNIDQNYGNSEEQNGNYKTITNKKRKYKNKSKRLKRQMTAMEEEEEHNVTEPTGKIYLEELYRGLFLDKFPKDLSGCPLVAAYRPWEPYIFKEDNTKTEENYEDTVYTEVSNMDDEYGDSSDTDKDDKVLGSKLTGIEYKMVQTIAERLHISIDIQVENKNLFHLFQQLIDGDIEMVVGGVDEDPSISQYVSSTIPYHQDDLTWCVAKAKRTYNFFNFMASFSMATWALIFTFVLATALTIVFIQKTSNVKISYLQGFFTVTTRIYGVLFSQTIQLKRLPSTLKICLGTAFFMSLMFSNIYHSFLISTLTTPKSSYQISHLDEIYSNRMSIMGSVENVRHLNKDGEIFKYIREKFQMCYNIEECLIRAANDDRIAVAVSRQHTFYNPRIPRDQLYCFGRDENIYVYLVTLLLPKKFHLLHKINPIIQHVIESGHMQKWARDLDMKRKIKEEVQRVREDPVKRLTMADVGGSFAFTAILLLFAFLVFVTECWVHWMVTKRRTRLKLVKMLHKKFK